MNTTLLIIAAITTIIMVIAIVIFYNVKSSPVVHNFFKLEQKNTDSYLQTYVPTPDGMISVNKNKGFKVSIPTSLDGYSELNLYSYPTMKLIQCIPYPAKVEVMCSTNQNEGVPEGNYYLYLRSQNPVDGIKTTLSFNYDKVTSTIIGTHKRIEPVDDTQFYSELGRKFRSEKFESKISQVHKTLYSIHQSISPASTTIRQETMLVTLETDQKALVIIPNRKTTMKLDSKLYLDGQEIKDIEGEDFITIALNGDQCSSTHISQIIYGCVGEVLPFYCYISH
jgi:hypothetical protein